MKTKKLTTLMFISFFALTSTVFSLSGMVVVYQKSIYATNNDYYSGNSISIIQKDANALIFNRNDFVNNKSFSLLVHGIKINVESNQGDYFIGVGPSSQLLNYVSNVSYEKARSFTFTYIPNSNIDFKMVNPTGSEDLTGNLPANQSFWENYSLNNQLTWKDNNQSTSFIILKQDGTPGLNINMKLSFLIPYLNKIDLEFIVLGIGSLFITIVISYISFKPVRT